MEKLKAGLAALPTEYEALRARHEKVHNALFGRTRIDLGGGAESARPIEDLIREGMEKGIYPPTLFEKLYDACRYAVISSSGELPPGGKGIWIGQWVGDWNTNFTLDTNLQLEVASLLSANLPELMEPLFQMFLSKPRMEDFRTNASRILGCKGIQVPQTTWFDCGLNVAWGGPLSSGEYWTAAAAWFAGIFYDYYRYTGDRHFLKERLVPFMKETARFYEDWLFRG